MQVTHIGLRSLRQYSVITLLCARHRCAVLAKCMVICAWMGFSISFLKFYLRVWSLDSSNICKGSALAVS